MYTLLNSVRDEKKEIIDKQKHKCLPLLVTHVHNHTEHFAVIKLALSYVSIWMTELAWGQYFPQLITNVLSPSPTFLFLAQWHKWEIC